MSRVVTLCCLRYQKPYPQYVCSLMVQVSGELPGSSTSMDTYSWMQAQRQFYVWREMNLAQLFSELLCNENNTDICFKLFVGVSLQTSVKDAYQSWKYKSDGQYLLITEPLTLFSDGGHHKVPLPWCLKTTQFYFLLVLENRGQMGFTGLKSRCWNYKIL